MIDLTKPLDLEVIEALSELQGNILKSHGRFHTAHLILQFDPNYQKTAKVWLSYFAKYKVTSALEQLLAAKRKRARLAGEEAGGEELFAMVLLSAAGYKALGFKNDEVPNDGSDRFQKGMGGSKLSKDPPKTEWEAPYNGEVHAMILLAHENNDQLKAEIKPLVKQISRFCKVYLEEGKKIVRESPAGKPVVVEHFGYADGISQPLFFKQDIKREIEESDNLHSLDLVLVEERPKSQTYGSFMVFRKLEQDVASFKALVAELAKEWGVTQREAGALVMGRDWDGIPLIKSSGQESSRDMLPNDFNFAEDQEGKVCPFYAHIRKTNPRDDLTRQAESNSSELSKLKKPVRIVRRSITYGSQPGLEVVAYRGIEPPASGVGLLFMSFQAELENFEILQLRADNEDFIKPGVGVDAIIGRHKKAISQSWSGQGNPAIAKGNLVKFKGGESFFAPSLPTLKKLSPSVELSEDQKERFSSAFKKLFEAPDNNLEKVGQLWAEDNQIKAMEKLGVWRQDFDDFYAYLLPFMPVLDVYTERQMEQRVRLDPEKVTKLKKWIRNNEELKRRLQEAFKQLLQPDKLRKYSALLVEKPEEALAFVGVSRDDTNAFYLYVEQYGLQLNIIPLF